MSSITRRRFVLALLAVVTIGIALRSIPLWHSPLPFNPDGIIHARNAEITVNTGHIPLSMDGVFTDDLGFASFLAVLQLLTGVQGLHIGQPVIAVLGTMPAILAAVLARRVGLQLDWPAGNARVAGLIAGALLATEGVYLYRSAPVDEQTPGLFLLPLAVMAVVYGLWTDDRRWLIVALPPLLYLPPLHNLESVLTGLSLVALLGLAAVRLERRRETLLAVSVITAGYWVYLIAYTLGVTALTPAAPHQFDRVTNAPGLLVAWTIVAVFGIMWSRRINSRIQRIVLLAPFVTLFALMIINVAVPIFPGLPETRLAFLVPTLALFVPVCIACWGYPSLTRSAPNRAVIVALIAGPLTLIGFTVSAELSPVYFGTGTRTHWFLHLPIMVLAGATTAYLLKEYLTNRRTVQVVFVGFLVLSVSLSVPIAFAELSIYSYQGITTPGEFSASTFAHDRIPEPWASDDHLVRISRYHPSNGSGTVAPVYTWVHNASTPPPNCHVLTKDSWTTVGAQFYPRPPATISHDRLNGTDAAFHRVYHGGATDSIRTFLPTTGTGASCS